MFYYVNIDIAAFTCSSYSSLLLIFVSKRKRVYYKNVVLY